MESKKPIQSKSLWFNLLTILAMILGALLADDTFREMIGSHAIFLIMAVNVINMIIRAYTDKPITIHPSAQKKTLNPLEQALKDDADEIGGTT